MIRNLSFPALRSLLQSVFGLHEREKGVAIMVDLPDEAAPDNNDWRDRRRIAADWFVALQGHLLETPFEAATCCTYRNTGAANADLPAEVLLVDRRTRHSTGEGSRQIPLEEILAGSSVVLAPTEFSATAPLKLLAKRLGFRGATLPGLTRRMLPLLGLDFLQVHRRVEKVKLLMDRAQSATLLFGAGPDVYSLFCDLRFRNGHASGGLMREAGVVGNLPSGEAYIVPYEGEREEEPSRTSGVLPVQFGEEIVLFRVERNRVVEVEGRGARAEAERGKLRAEPAYGNIAELGIGVLGEWNVEAVGSTLVDEKLGVHIAFGRSDHFGGVTSPARFRRAQNVIHIDWVYVPSIQPGVVAREVAFDLDSGERLVIIRDGKLVSDVC